MNAEFVQRIERARAIATEALRAEMTPGGYWTGELSSSALSTATAITALATVDAEAHKVWIRNGLDWLVANANEDGGWGDTNRSGSNLSTTALVWAAYGAAGMDATYSGTVARTIDWIKGFVGSLENLVPALEALYGKDRTFSVPITMTLALSGRLGPDGWKKVRSLPFELATLPRGLFGALQLPVVSYALPALIAIGQVIHHRSGRFNPLRSATRKRTLNVLTTLQPSNGGFLEATPLTSFVTMSLAGMGLARHVVADRGAEFLRRSVRADGSWPIDTNLATWATSLSLKALSHVPAPMGLSPEQMGRAHSWLLGQQYREQHPYTGAAPGGWAWTDLPGGVPDADDTAGVLLALQVLGPIDDRTRTAALNGVDWLLGLQNRDGGIPTFCRGWGALPFDRSSPELTAHALRAWAVWLPDLATDLAGRTRSAMWRAVQYLRTSQRQDGAWLPLWFGNEAATLQENPVYGTAQVLLIQASGMDVALSRDLGPALAQGAAFLIRCQNEDGGWGGNRGVASTTEETSLALAALSNSNVPDAMDSMIRGTEWLLHRIESDLWGEPAPIGLYFARLWYFEKLYPLIFAVEALGRVSARVAQTR